MAHLRWGSPAAHPNLRQPGKVLALTSRWPPGARLYWACCPASVSSSGFGASC